MTPTDEELSVLQNIEFTIVEIARTHPEMTDYTALRAYEAAFDFYRAERRGHVPKIAQFTGSDGEAFQSVRETCEFRLGRAQQPLPDGLSPISLELLTSCLRQLIKSVQRHTRIDGRFGYITFIKKFVS